MSRLVLLMRAEPRQAAGPPVTVRASSATRVPGACIWDGHEWLPAIVRAPTFRLDIFSADLTADVQADYGQVEVRLSSDLGNRGWARLIWDGAPLSLWIGREGAAWTDFVRVFNGRAGPLETDGALGARITLRGAEAALDRHLLTATYAGTGGPEGEASLKGVLKPWTSGVCEGVSGVLVSRTHWVWQVHGYGEVDDVLATYEQGISLGASSGDFATYASLIGASLQEGQWATCRTLGMVRLGAEPAGKVVFDVQGARDGADWPDRAAAIAAHLMRHGGVPASDISAASINAFDSAFPHAYGIHISSQTTVGDAVRRIMSDVLGYALPDGDGVWRFGRWVAGKTPATLRTDRSALPLVRSARVLPVAAPAGRVRVGSRPCWSPHSETEISPALLEKLIDAREELERIASDNVLHRSEKPVVVLEKQALDAQISEMTTRATALGVSTAAVSTAVNALNNYLAGLSPAWNDATQSTVIVRSTWNSTWGAVYSALSALEREILENTEGVGDPGPPGQSTGVAVIYRRAATAPAGPTQSATLTVGTNTITGLNNGWSATFPATDGNPAWRREYRWVTSGTTVVIAPDDWSSSVEVVRDGEAASALVLEADGQIFRFNAAGRADPPSQSITITAQRSNLAGTILWTSTPTVTLTGSGDSRALSVADFGSHERVIITASLGSVSDSVTIYRLQDARSGNLVDTSGWQVGTSGNQPGGWTAEQSVSTETRIVMGGSSGHPLGPSGASEVLVEATSADWDLGPPNYGNADGGFQGPVLQIDHRRAYRFSVWVYWPAYASAGNQGGFVYFGSLSDSALSRSQVWDGNAWVNSPNPYWLKHSRDALAGAGVSAGRWYLAVGILYGSDSTLTACPVSGLYDTEGRRLLALSTFRQRDVAGDQRIRFFQYYSDHAAKSYWARPRVDALDGSEPSLHDLLQARPITIAQSLVGLLTNEAHAVPAAADGTVQTWTGASGNFRVFYGGEEVTGASTFSVQSNPKSVATSITSAGAYSVTGTGSWAASDTEPALVTYRASYVTPGGATLTADKVFTVTKSRAGVDGDPGSDGLTAGGQAIFEVSCDAAGNPKSGQIPQTRQLRVFQGATDVTASATWSISGSGGGTVTVSSAGLVTLSGITADEFTRTVTATIGSQSLTWPMSARKVRDGASGVSASITVSFPTSSTAQQLGMSGEIALPAGMALDCSVAAAWESSGGPVTCDFWLQARINGGAWTTLGSSDGATAIASEPAFVTLARTLSSSTSARIVEVRLMGSNSNSTDTINGQIGPAFAQGVA